MPGSRSGYEEPADVVAARGSGPPGDPRRGRGSGAAGLDTTPGAIGPRHRFDRRCALRLRRQLRGHLLRARQLRRRRRIRGRALRRACRRQTDDLSQPGADAWPISRSGTSPRSSSRLPQEASSRSSLGSPLMRLSGLSAGIATFAVLIITNNVLRNWEAIGPGAKTLSLIPQTTGFIQATVGLLIVMAVAFLYQLSRGGRRLRATREDPAAAQSSGNRHPPGAPMGFHPERCPRRVRRRLARAPPRQHHDAAGLPGLDIHHPCHARCRRCRQPVGCGGRSG